MSLNIWLEAPGTRHCMAPSYMSNTYRVEDEFFYDCNIILVSVHKSVLTHNLESLRDIMILILEIKYPLV
jgi:hypothetical protein